MRSRMEAYVDVAGRDDGKGSMSDPFATLHRALDWLARERAKTGGDTSGALTVNLLRGVHRVEGSLMFGPEHAGTKASPTILRGHGAAVTGSAPIGKTVRPADTTCASAPSLSAIDLPAPAQADIGDFGFNRPIAPAPPFLLSKDGALGGNRLPARGWFTTERSGLDRQGSTLQLTLSEETFRQIEGEPALWVEFLFKADWDWHIAYVRSIDATTRRLTFEVPHDARRAAVGPFRFAFRNLRSALSRPGTSWLDPAHRQVVFHPPLSGEAELCAMAGHLVRLHDTKHVVIEGIRFRGGLANAIHATGCEDLSVVSCTAEDFAAGGFHFEGRRNIVRESIFANIGTTALRIETGDPASLAQGESIVERCTFKRWGSRKPIYEPAVRLIGVGATVRDCAFSDAPHLAIEISGNDHLIEGCTFEKLVTEIDDMGAIYVNTGENPLQRGHLIRRNLFRDIGHDRSIASGVYLDRTSAGVSVCENAFLRIAGSDAAATRAIHINGGRDLEIARNLFVDCDCSVELSFYLTTWGIIDVPAMEAGLARAVATLAASPHLQKYPELAKLAAQSLTLPASNRICGNTSFLGTHGARGIVVSAGDPELVEQAGNTEVSPSQEILNLGAPWNLMFGASGSTDPGAEIDRVFADWSVSLADNRMQSAG